jgi:hypothetical protein
MCLYPMQHSFRVPSGHHLIPVDGKLLDGLERPQIEQAIRKIVRNVRFKFLEGECAIRLLGPDMYYHALDPHLTAVLARFDPPLAVHDILAYHAPGDLFDLCLEDSWSGWSIAEHLRRGPKDEDLVLIHLDDHRDVMSTLLECSDDGGLIGPSTRQPFDPEMPKDWETAIAHGSVGIGSFLTPFYFGGRRTHVRHLNNAGTSSHQCSVIRKPCSYDLIPEKRFAAVQLAAMNEVPNAGSYVVSSHCDELLEGLPRGRVIVHVDLDFLINDFNGNASDGAAVPGAGFIQAARRKIDHFFHALYARRVKVDGWIIATSPGFCSALHWDWMLNAFTEKIAAHRNASSPLNRSKTRERPSSAISRRIIQPVGLSMLSVPLAAA